MTHINRLIRSKRRTLALIVERDGSLTVRAPLHLADSEIDQFIISKKNWIIRKQVQASKTTPVIHHYQSGEIFSFLGVDYPLRLVPNQKPALIFKDGFRLNQAHQPEGERLFVNWYRRHARSKIEERVTHFSRLHGFKSAKLRISSARTRWGSCSRQGTLSFTWRLIMAPEHVINYVVVHELCHLRHLNHSKDFWRSVFEIFPDYKRTRAWLKQHGDRLQL